MHGSHCEAWRRGCDGVGAFCWWHCWGFIQNWRHIEPAWLPQHPAATCQHIWFAFSGSFVFQQDEDPKHNSRLREGYLIMKESDGVLRQMTWPRKSPNLNPTELVWDELDHWMKAKQPTIACTIILTKFECFTIPLRPTVRLLLSTYSKYWIPAYLQSLYNQW